MRAARARSMAEGHYIAFALAFHRKSERRHESHTLALPCRPAAAPLSTRDAPSARAQKKAFLIEIAVTSRCIGICISHIFLFAALLVLYVWSMCGVKRLVAMA